MYCALNSESPLREVPLYKITAWITTRHFANAVRMSFEHQLVPVICYLLCSHGSCGIIRHSCQVELCKLFQLVLLNEKITIAMICMCVTQDRTPICSHAG